jgi:hypothetical protein
VGELAYDVNPKLGYRVYIEESGAYVPYLVVTADYGGSVLLVREHLLATTMPFKENEGHEWKQSDYAAYYEDSSIDEYLNTDFYDTFDRSVPDAIVSSWITITDKASMSSTAAITHTIPRKVFLLSLFELTGMEFDSTVPEGESLQYFMDDYNRRYAALPNGEAHPSWTRTPSTKGTYTVTTIGSNGTIGAEGADVNNGIRPAFCLKESTKVKQRTDIVDGQTVYTIYTDDSVVHFTSGQYRIVRINGPADVSVYNDAGRLVASIIDDKPQKVSSIIASKNEDGEKVVFLSAPDSYTVKITATGDGLMTYSVNEYDPEAGGVNRLVNYYDLPLSTGREFTGSIPGYSNSDLENRSEDASSVLYTLSADGEEILPSEELSGESATSANFTVKAVPSDRSLGLVFGSGSRQLGAFAKVKAVLYPDSKFLGWYNDEGELVGSELEYRMRVEEDTDLTAKFERTKQLEPEPDTNSPVELEYIFLDKSTITLDIGDTATLSVNYSPANAAERPAVTWESINANIATVDAKGRVSAKAQGTVFITAAVKAKPDIMTVVCVVTVKDPR